MSKIRVEFFAYLEGGSLDHVSETAEFEFETVPNVEEMSDRADEYANRMEELHGGHAISYGYDFIL